MNARAPIDLSVGVIGLSNSFTEGDILQAPLAGCAFLPGIIATFRHLQDPTHRLHRILLLMLGDQFAPVMQGTIDDPQITGHLGNALPARLHEAYRLLFKLLRKRSLVFRHLGFPFLTKYIPSSPTLSNRGKPISYCLTPLRGLTIGLAFSLPAAMASRSEAALSSGCGSLAVAPGESLPEAMSLMVAG